MRKTKVKFNVYLFTILSVLTITCSVNAEEIIFESSVKYKKNEATEFTELKAQESLAIGKGDRVFVNTQEGIPLIILSAQQANSKITIPNIQLSMVALEQSRPYLEKTTNEVIEGLRRVENLISKRDYTQAVTRITALKEKYKGLSAVLFLSGTANYLANNKTAAIKDLESGLLINPENSSAKRLLEKIKKEI